MELSFDSIWGQQKTLTVNRTQGLKIFSLALAQLSYQGITTTQIPSEVIEPSTLGLLDPHSNQLSYEGTKNSTLEKLKEAQTQGGLPNNHTYQL